MNQDYDIMIVGAGMVGLACARLLADTGLRIGICETQEISLPELNDDYDLRVSALNKNSQQLIQTIGCWDAIQSLRSGPYDKMHVWDQADAFQLDFSAAELAQDYLGYIVENSIIRKALHDNLPQNIEWLCPIKLTSVVETDDRIQLITEDGQVYQTKLVIGADGGHSWLRQQVGIEVKTYPYQQQAIVATVKTALAHQQTAYQCFLTTGPLAFLPLDNAYHSSIVWSADDAFAKQLLALPKIEFAAELSAIMSSRLGSVELVSEIKFFPLHMRHANEYVKSGVALMGDAVRTIHPLAGQGVNLGFRDAMDLAAVIKTAINKKHNFASVSTLKKYQRARKSQTIAMIVAMEFFKQAFAKQGDKFSKLRNNIIGKMNRYEILKGFFAKIASGDEVF